MRPWGDMWFSKHKDKINLKQALIFPKIGIFAYKRKRNAIY